MLWPTLRPLLPFLIVLAVVGIVAALIRQFLLTRTGKDTTTTSPPAFIKKDYLLSGAERLFFEALHDAVGSDFHIFAKVRMEDLVYLPKGTQNWQAAINKVRQKHVDFLLCDRRWVSPVLVIELDDSTHQREDVRGRDAEKDAILEQAGLPILRVTARRAYVVRELREAVVSRIGKP